MAIPKVFVSSTCFDLKEVRDSLSRFIKSYGFDPILSEHGDVFYHPDLHTHEACVHEVSNCQLFILIIGGRFGGTYLHDKEKSITNAEYEAAKASNIPVFTYIKKGVYDNHHTYQANKNKEFIKDMDFPNIEKQENSLDIFNFIDQVRKSKVNNAFETFETSIEIEIHLRKQWAGMFFDYLKNREVREQVNVANLMLSTLQTSSDKLEEMLKGLYDKPTVQETTLDHIENKYSAIRFFEIIIQEGSAGKVYLGEYKKLDTLSKVNPKDKTWYQYLIELECFKRIISKENNDEHLEFIGEGDYGGKPILKTDDNAQTFQEYYHELIPSFENGLQKTTTKERKEILKKFLKS